MPVLFMMAAFLGGIGAVTLSQASLIRIEAKMANMQSFHSPALSTIQNIESDLIGAVKESFAYVISGEVVEKQDFEHWVRSFPESAHKFEKFAKLDDSENAKQKATYEQFLVVRDELQKGAMQMFADFEQTGAVSHETFMTYENAIDEIGFIVDDLVAAQRLNVESHYASSLSLVSRSGLVLTIIGAAVMFVAGFIGIMAGRQMSAQVSDAKGRSDPSIASSEKIGGPRALSRTATHDQSAKEKDSAAA